MQPLSFGKWMGTAYIFTAGEETGKSWTQTSKATADFLPIPKEGISFVRSNRTLTQVERLTFT
jgi:hypothetical protein